MSDTIILAIDQGTTSTRSMTFGTDGVPRQTVRREFEQHYPKQGWVEHDAEDIWRDTVDTLKEVHEADGGTIAGIGITNQRETVVVGSQDRQARPQRDRLAGSPHRQTLCAAQGRR